jgi:hypothetical protein
VRELESNNSQEKLKLKQRLEEMRPTLNPKNQQIIDIALDFLQFNPFFRMSSFECLLNCRVFDTVRDMKKEDYLRKLILKQENIRNNKKVMKIELNIDRVDAFEYENTSNAKYSVDELKKMVIDEIIFYNHKNGLKIDVGKFYANPLITNQSTN